MAILIPEIPKDCNSSERLVYERLGRELPERWVVMHSLGLGSHEKKVWGEADIVVLSTHGIFALEVKGGKVECLGGEWKYSGDFPTFYKKESPWQQATGAMFALKTKLTEVRSFFHDIMFGCGVVMPFTNFTDTGAEIVQEVLLDKRDFRDNLDRYISSLQKYWSREYTTKHGKPYRGLREDEIQVARQILRPDLETALSLGTYLTGTDNALLYLTNEQIRVSRRGAANPRTVVRGSAGTGKTVLAVDRAKQLSKGGARVLFLTFNQLLAEHLRQSLAVVPDAENVEVHHAHSYFRSLIGAAGLSSKLAGEDEDKERFFRKVMPAVAWDALVEKPIEPFDVLIVDEAQDLLTPENLDVFDLLLKEGMQRGRWHLYLDPKQNIYNVETVTEVEDRLSEGAPAFDDLYDNCRNTKQVATQASIVSGIDLAVEGAPDGQPAQIHEYDDDNDAVAQLENLLEQLIDSDVEPDQIAILATRRKENSFLAEVAQIAGRSLADPRQEREIARGALLMSTMHAFKGLDRQVVIAIEMGDIGAEQASMLHYAGLSRARGLLHVFLPRKCRPAYDRQAVAYGSRIGAKSNA
ncbi:DUF2075 domain-containing protein [Qipengyuania sp. GH38]|uniref:nuclease-related domain-containing DEAD/DEAH box helicase n=1 Tax=Qipengyuania intermedia TaxID=2867244 RepID=UPI001C887562|nr:DNA/RNA helicase domain-containing protein [Qipengyuania intermedia]MBX7512987.1 DUF2075 domain-containing protein [Qipengyuania intermedia]